jgi:AcrR family transcriptional regulator
VPPRRERVREPTARALEREQEIYTVAAEMFHRKGYAATTLQDIADAVGLLKGSLYYYIDSKEDLLYRIARSLHAHATANMERAKAVDGPPPVRLRTLIEGHVLAFGRRLTIIRVFYTEHASLTGPRRAEIMGVRAQYAGYAEELLREGQADGSFCPDLDAGIMTNAILTMVNSVYVWYRPERYPDIGAVARMLADFTLAGLRCSADHSHSVYKPARRAASQRRTAKGRRIAAQPVV